MIPHFCAFTLHLETVTKAVTASKNTSTQMSSCSYLRSSNCLPRAPNHDLLPPINLVLVAVAMW